MRRSAILVNKSHPIHPSCTMIISSPRLECNASRRAVFEVVSRAGRIDPVLPAVGDSPKTSPPRIRVRNFQCLDSADQAPCNSYTSKESSLIGSPDTWTSSPNSFGLRLIGIGT